MNEFIQQFLLESREYVEQGTADLLALEKAPGNKAHLDSAFRAFHTLKGGAGIVDFASMAEAVHAAEDALSAVRSGSRVLTAQLVGDCITCLDQVVQWLDIIETTGELPTDAQALASVIVARFAQHPIDAAGRSSLNANAASVDWVQRMLAKDSSFKTTARTAFRYVPEADCFFRGQDPFERIAGLPGLLTIDCEAVRPWPTLDRMDPFVCNLILSVLTESSRSEIVAGMGDAIGRCDVCDVAGKATPELAFAISPRLREVLEAQSELIALSSLQGSLGRLASAGRVAANVLRSVGRTADVDHVVRGAEMTVARSDPRFLREAIEFVLREGPQNTTGPLTPAADRSVAIRTLRIEASRIDALVNLTGELAVAKNSIGYVAKLIEQGDPGAVTMLKRRHAALDRLVGELQQSVLGMRVLTLRHVFQRFPRLVREMSIALGKQVNLVLDGEDTEADKAIVEMLFEPLLHVLRNAMDHGVEHIAVRTLRNKPSLATIRLSAQRQDDDIVIEVNDDGGGVDVARIRQVALERNLVTEDVLSSMSDATIIDMIFEPGFSTATKVTGVSGRGVGMDAVRTAVQRVGGRVSIESRAGHGATVRFTMPFSVMVTRVMVVTAGAQTFGIPIDAVIETMRVDADRISPIGSAYAMVLRNRTIPVLDLCEALGLPHTRNPAADATIVVTLTNGQYGGLRVDRIGERMDVMLKPLDGLLAGIPGVAGSTLIGDGTVLLVLDLAELFQ